MNRSLTNVHSLTQSHCKH